MIWHIDPNPYALGPWRPALLGGQEFGIRWYSLPYIITFLVVYYVLTRAARQRRIPNATPERMEDAALLLLLSVMVGGRVGYFLLNQPSKLLTGQGWLEMFQIWHGGMAFFGAVALVVVVDYWYCQRHHISFWHATDHVAWIIAIGLGFGRIANFINSELIGIPTGGPWGVVFDSLPPEAWINMTNPPRHPVQLYSALTHFLLGFWLLYLLRRKPRREFDRVPGFTCFWFLGGYGLLRFITDFWRVETTWIIPGVFSGGQALSLALFLLALLGARLRAEAVRKSTEPCAWYPEEGFTAPLPDECHAYLDAQTAAASPAPKAAPPAAKPKQRRR